MSIFEMDNEISKCSSNNLEKIPSHRMELLHAAMQPCNNTTEGDTDDEEWKIDKDRPRLKIELNLNKMLKFLIKC